MARQRSDLWLPLLVELTAATPDFTVWKNVDSALQRRGDVDSAAPRAVWPLLEQAVLAWARALRIGPVVVCRHIPRTLNLLTVLEQEGALLQLEVKAGATFRGSLQFSAADVVALSVLDPRGFRRLRPGAEGVLKLLNNGMSRGGAVDADGLRAKQVPALLAEDHAGVEAMARRFGPAGPSLLRGVDAVLAGSWDRPAMARVEAWALAKAVVQPHVVAERVWFRAVRKPHDPVLQSVYQHDREVRGDVQQWLATAARAHPVHALG